jgi:predicted metalloendopeptidase
VIRRLLFAALLVPAALAAQPLDLKRLGPAAEACTDFDAYVNGIWRASTPLPDDRARAGSFESLRTESRAIVERALADAARDPARLDTPGKRLAATFYASGMDRAAIERRGLASLDPLLAEIDGLDDRARIPVIMAKLARIGVSAPIAAGVVPDPGDRRRYIVATDQGGLGLPDRDDYTAVDSRSIELRNAYAAYRRRLAELAGVADAGAAAAASVALQSELAKASQTRVERRNPSTVYQLNTLGSLAARAPGIDWAAFFATLGVAQPGEFNVASPRFMAAVARLAAEAPLPQWRAYFRERLLDELAPTLPAPFVDARFAYRGRAILGFRENFPRAEQVILLMTGPFGSEPLAEGLGELYVARAFSPLAKARAVEMIDDIRAAMRVRIERLDWMSAPTKAAAIRKLDAMAVKIGYPDRWKTYDGLVITGDDYSGNFLRARAWNFNDRMADLGKPVDRTRWSTTPHLVNAFAGGLNEIVFPAAILQPPFFYPDADPAVNYGAIGSVIGHEITHHFDDRGRQFDAFGNLADWWTPADAANYKARADRLAEQFSAYEPLPGNGINGRQTLGENISDLGGVKIAYDGLQLALQRQPIGPIDGLTQQQRYFIAYGIIWRTAYRTEFLLNQLRTGQHSPSRYRVLGPLANFPAFARAFNCPADAPMMRSAEQQISIW